jgi:hypothetical protein
MDRTSQDPAPDRDADAERGTSPPGESTEPAGPAPSEPDAPGDASKATEEEMGGEAPCQLHRFWDVEP